jgi:hypothetical protein
VFVSSYCYALSAVLIYLQQDKRALNEEQIAIYAGAKKLADRAQAQLRRAHCRRGEGEVADSLALEALDIMKQR